MDRRLGHLHERDACGIGFVADLHGRASRAIVTAGLAGLTGVRHRGAVAADSRTTDGCGMLTPVPSFLTTGTSTDDAAPPTVLAMLFVRGAEPHDAVVRTAADVGLEVVGWREPPTDPTVLGDLARASLPTIRQVLLAPRPALLAQPTHPLPHPTDLAGRPDPLERAAWRFRRRLRVAEPDTYVVSCSARSVVHKGLVPAEALADFWLDLADDRFVAPFAVFHQRFSTNTLPTWERAQPFRTLCHNGEINTIWGNEHRLRARARLGTDDVGLCPEDEARPVVEATASDSAQLDEVVELLVHGGRHVTHALAMTVPPAWEEVRDLDPAVRGFHAYHAALMEPWDGPAGLIVTDGLGVGAALDRNGLRPLRYAVCEDGFVACGSETGAVPLSGHGAVEHRRLGPGEMLWIVPGSGLIDDRDLKRRLADLAPFGAWAADGFRRLGPGQPLDDARPGIEARQVAHGYTREDLAMVLKPMAGDAKEASFAMGDDAPLPHLAGRPRPLFHFFRQRFAQVTNPPIDPLRERSVMSLRTMLGPRAPLLSAEPQAAQLLELDSFFLFPDGVDRLHRVECSPFPVEHLDATFPAADAAQGLDRRLTELADAAADAVRAGVGIVVIDHGSIDLNRAPVPSLLALGAVHARLVDEHLRSDASLVVVADDARDTHGVACLLGYGADAVCPRLALETVATEADAGEDGELVGPEAQARFRTAIEAGVLKILSKMGICTVDSYRGAQTFEILGLSDAVVDRCFPGTPSVVGGLDLEQLAAQVLAEHRSAFAGAPDGTPALTSTGWIRVRADGEPHAHDKAMVSALNELTLTAAPVRRVDSPVPDAVVAEMAAAHLLQRAIAGGDDELYARFARLVDERPPIELHDQLTTVTDDVVAVPLEEVESARSIVRRFSTGAMSLGALSREAHENLARAMNLIGARSNCGEGGEDPARFRTRGLGREDRNSAIKQVASGRFGVTPEYLAFADEIQIKMAQGSKPGEGGQLPGHKVTEEIARLRHTQPGVGLISPPPHHDIYSIEDLAQLIYDLKQVNAAEVSVKLVAGDGVGTIASGCVKALADVVHLSGANGGTGASPLSSIKHAGMPWEIGLADVQQALVAAGLRDRARLRVDGGFKTGRQVIVAALLGADEYSFGTAAMIAEGCIMLRACHRDTCKPGVATQRPNLRANFTGTPEGVAAYLLFVAEDVRRRLAALGARSLEEVIGRVELLGQRHFDDPVIDSVDLAPLLRPPDSPTACRRFRERVELQHPRAALGDQVLADAFRPIWDGDHVELDYVTTNADRCTGTALSGALALEFGSTPPRGSARINLRGVAGQSLGAFLGAGIDLDLVGSANDYVGKGMAGGRIVIRPDEATTTGSRPPVLAGNTCLYGATGGVLHVAGAVGERFAVRNSGAVAVVEAVGDHCCEYMTGGTVVVLGRVGHNVGAGMTGGEAFVWDPEAERLMARLNLDLIEPLRPDDHTAARARWLVEEHAEATGSTRAQVLLATWHELEQHLWHLVPRDRSDRIAASTAQRVTVA